MTTENLNEVVEVEVENNEAIEKKIEQDLNEEHIVKRVTVFGKIGNKLDNGFTKIGNGVKKHWKPVAKRTAQVGGAILGGIAAAVVVDAVVNARTGNEEPLQVDDDDVEVNDVAGDEPAVETEEIPF